MEKQLRVTKNGNLAKLIQKFIWFLFVFLFSHADVSYGWVEVGQQRHGFSSKFHRIKHYFRFLIFICLNNIYILYFKVGLSYPSYTYALTRYFLWASNLLIHTNIEDHVTLGRYVFILDSKFNF